MTPAREKLIEAMARGFFDCYSGYNEETKHMMWMHEKSILMARAARALSAIHDAGYAVVPREMDSGMAEVSNREWDGRISYRSSGAWEAVVLASDLAAPAPEPIGENGDQG